MKLCTTSGSLQPVSAVKIALLLAGRGEVDWSSLNTVCPSELLKFEESAAAALEQAILEDQGRRSSCHGDRSPSPILSPRGMGKHILDGGNLFNLKVCSMLEYKEVSGSIMFSYIAFQLTSDQKLLQTHEATFLP